MEFQWILIIVVAIGASMLTFFSGFGLGTILLPVFALFFPVDLSIAMTAIVHFLNNIFKTGLIGRQAKAGVVLNFGLPALIFAVAGALTLDYISHFPIHIPYKLFGFSLATNILNVIIGLLLIIFAIVEIIPKRPRGSISRLGLIAGGALSGFFGGLSGHQGALRSAFLIRLGLTKEAFIATGIVISLFVDVSRLTVYGKQMDLTQISDQKWLILSAVLAAFVGAVAGRNALRKIWLRLVHFLVAAGIIVIGILMALGAL